MYLTGNDDEKERVGQETGPKECRILMRSDATFGQGSKKERQSAEQKTSMDWTLKHVIAFAVSLSSVCPF